MTTAERPLAAAPTARASGKITDYPRGGLRFDFVVAVACVTMIVGLYQDGWAHNHNYVDETFFTPWHLLLYASMGVVGVLLAVTQYRNVARGHVWSKALPHGYLLSLVGVVGFFAAGGLDFIWHSAFGLEVSVEALLSPPHLFLATAGVCIVLGPLRAAWARPASKTPPGWRGLFPALLSMGVALSVFTFFSAYANLFTFGSIQTYNPQGFEMVYDVTGIAFVVFPAALMVGSLLLLLRRWSLPPGSVTLLIFGNALLMTWLYTPENDSYHAMIAAALAAGLIGDALLAKLRPSAERRGALRLFAFTLPLILFGGALGGLVATTGLYWSVHMWLGVTFLSGLAGLCLSYVSVPPPMPDSTD